MEVMLWAGGVDEGLSGGGTGGPVTRFACLSAVTQERIATLKTTYGWRLEK
jgi:hypothetical protein